MSGRSLIPAAYRGGGEDDPVGSTIAGCRVERLLGRGGMGAAYLARAADGRPVVVKLLAPELRDDVHVAARFQREGEALRQLPAHPHLVPVLAVAGGERPAIVMDYVAGTSLFQLVRERGRLPARAAATLAGQVASGLAAAHARGLIHRDLTANNILRAEDGGARVIDFGIAKDLARSTLTRDGQMLGTVHYMAPELLEGVGRASPACDVFSLGVTLYLLVTGRLPFRGAHMEQVAEALLAGDYEPPRSLAPDLPVELERALHQLLHPDPRRR